MLEFTRALYDLFGKEGISLSTSLMIMKAKPKQDVVSRAAASIYSALESGSLLSNAMRACKVLSFDDVYISFISIAEKNGDLKTALLYLKEKLERKEACHKRLVEASIYPVFVILLSVTASVFIGIYTETENYFLLVKYLLLLFSVCGGLYFILVKMLCDNPLFEAFTAVDFLLQNGVELSEAVACAVQIAGPSSKVGKLFENARVKLSYGMDLQRAFCCSPKVTEAFYYADAGGCKEDLFSRIASYLAAEKERSRTICLSLLEPVFIVITGAFILALLVSFFMPLINSVGW